MVQRLLIIGLDGYEGRIAEHLMKRGRMPNLAALKDRSAHLELDHGAFKRTGLAWRHFSTGLAPDKSGVWSAVTFDPAHYSAKQLAGVSPPFLTSVGGRAIVLDAPYFDLGKAEGVRGFVNWGAHDPGVEALSRPDQLLDEIIQRFGPYPAADDIYGFVWPNAEHARDAADRLTRALDLRSDVTQWLLAERMPDWDVALTVVSELHSAIEPFWHGFDDAHPLHDLPSGATARDGLFAVYEALDRMIGRLSETCPDAAIMMFSMHGMGHNDADVPSMILLPEFMYRLQFGQERFSAPDHWTHASVGTPMLGPNDKWESAIFDVLKKSRSIAERARNRFGRAFNKMNADLTHQDDRVDFGLDWMPSTFYAPFWKDMRAFALPSYYDGRIRLNIKGREAHGLVAANDYDAEIARIERELLQLTDVGTGKAVVEELIRTSPGDPMGVPDTDGDLVVIWRGDALGFRHPNMRQIGPAPYRRTGGHTGGHGDLFLAANDVEPGEYGLASAFDVAPTVEDFLGINNRMALSGESALPRLKTRIGV